MIEHFSKAERRPRDFLSKWSLTLTALLGTPMILSAVSLPAQAGVFAQPEFVTTGQFALGIEPEIFFANGASVGINLHYTHGINELINLGATVGTGDDYRRFRLGARAVFDFFPDGRKQPGLGLATSGTFLRTRDGGQVELMGQPYLHKSFTMTSGTVVEPFVAVPLGMRFLEDGRYQTLVSLSVGSIFKVTEKLAAVFELSLAAINTSSSISGGISYVY